MTRSLTSKHSHQTIYCLVRHNPTSNPVTMKTSKWTIIKNWEQELKKLQAYTSLFWKRWLSEYLPTLSPRTKWTNKQQNFAVGDLVIVRNKNTPKSHWPLARIVAIYLETTESLGLVKYECRVESLLDLVNCYFCWSIQNNKMFESYRFTGEGGCSDVN